MDALMKLMVNTLTQVWVTFQHNWPFLTASVLIAVVLKLYLDSEKVSAFLKKYQKAGVWGATAVAVSTPLCSCGTTAIILGMMASTMPWTPIVAFMVSSPLTSPEELVYSAGLFGWPFAVVFFISSILLGLFGGLVAGFAQKRGWLENQARFDMSRNPKGQKNLNPVTPPSSEVKSCACNSEHARPDVVKMGRLANRSLGRIPRPVYATSACCGEANLQKGLPPVQPALPTVKGSACETAVEEVRSCGCENNTVKKEKMPITFSVFMGELFRTSRTLLLMFTGFAFIGYFLNSLIPSEWIVGLFGSGNFYSIPLAATLGLPLYINTEASLPLVRALLDNGMSQGAALSFLITGSGTSIGALTGALTIARWRVIAIVIGTLWLGSIALGFLYNALITLGLF